MLICVAANGDGTLSNRLESIHSKIITDYDTVNHLSAEQFSQIDKGTLVIFDVREKKEYEVSHIDGAIQIHPDFQAGEFLPIYGEAIKGKTLVFYCSVGRRSSKLLSEINQIVHADDVPEASYNLTGGIFHWHNMQKPLINLEQTTSAIHPYNFYWGRLIENKSAISYSPTFAL